MEQTKIFIDQIRKAGYAADNAGDVFELYYSECSADHGLEDKAEEAGVRLDVVSAALAHLKTSRYIGITDKAAYDIRSTWDLTDEEYDFVAEAISADPATYHQGDYILTSSDEQEEAYIEETVIEANEIVENDIEENDIEENAISEVSALEVPEEPVPEEPEVAKVTVKKPRLRIVIKIIASLTGVLFLVSSIAFFISLSLYSEEPGCDRVTVNVRSVIRDFDRYSRYRYGESGNKMNNDTSDNMVVIEVAGSYEKLYGVPDDEIAHLMSVAQIKAYRYNGSYYYTRQSASDSRMCARVAMYSAILMCVSGVAFFVSLSLSIHIRKKNRRGNSK